MLKKMIVIITCLLSLFLIYKINYNDKKDYLALGDGLAKGVTYYNAYGLGYSDYLSNYLEEEKKLKTFNKTFTYNHISIDDFQNIIKRNKCNIVKGKKECIHESIKNAEVITVSIGNNEISEILKNYNYNEETKKLLDEIINKINKTMDLLNKYSETKIYLIGFYSYGNKDNDKIIKYIDSKLETNNKYKYIKISQLFNKNITFLPNVYENYPSQTAYQKIAQIIVKEIK